MPSTSLKRRWGLLWVSGLCVSTLGPWGMGSPAGWAAPAVRGSLGTPGFSWEEGRNWCEGSLTDWLAGSMWGASFQHKSPLLWLHWGEGGLAEETAKRWKTDCFSKTWTLKYGFTTKHSKLGWTIVWLCFSEQLVPACTVHVKDSYESLNLRQWFPNFFMPSHPNTR